MSRLKKGIYTLIILMIVTVYFLYRYEFPRKINIEYPAVAFVYDAPHDFEETTISIKGNVKRPLFRDEYFEGKFMIDKYPVTKESNVKPIHFYNQEIIPEEHPLIGQLNYEHPPPMHMFGVFTFERNFEKVMVFPYESDNLMIVAPATRPPEVMPEEGTWIPLGVIKK